MRSPVQSGEPVEYRRPIHNPRTHRLLSDAGEALGALNEEISNASPTNEGIVLFTPDDFHVGSANAVLSLDGHNTAAETLRFRKENIDGHRIVLGSTAVGYLMGRPRPEFRQSRMSPEDITWGGTYRDQKGKAHTVQAVFSMHEGGDLPNEDDMARLWQRYLPDVAEAVSLVNQVVPEGESLSTALELLPPVTPNAYVVRWDSVGSSRIATTDRYGSYASYRGKWLSTVDQILRAYPHATNNQGDGQNIALWLHGIDVNVDPEIRQYGTQTVMPIIEKLEAAHRALAAQYPDFSPRIRIGVGLGHLEEGYDAEKTGPVLWEVADLMKQSPEAHLHMTQAAKNALLWNKKTPA